MNKNKCFLLFNLIFGLSNSQINQKANYDPRTNSYEVSEVLPNGSSTRKAEARLSHNSTCSTNKFWAINNGGVDELTLVGNTVTFNSTIISPKLNYSIAYCDNLDGITPSSTFYDANGNSQAYYNGAAWQTPGTPTYSYNIYNCGGYQTNLYYGSAPSGFQSEIVKYNGTSFNKIYSTPPTYFLAIADLAVDKNGNVWTAIAKNFPYPSDSLIVVSPTGQVILEYPFIFDTNNAYGSFIIDSTLYIGFGPANVNYPNSLVPIRIQNGAVSIGAPIAMPANGYSDLASCAPGILTALPEIKNNETLPRFVVFPNPNNGSFKLQIENQIKNGQLILLNSIGQKIYEQKIIQGSNDVKITSLPNGMYSYVLLQDGHTIGVGKLSID
jgi:hypothetical protein